MSQELSVPVYGQDGKETSKLSINIDDLGGKVKLRLLKEVVSIQENNQRQGNRKTKTRGQIQGTSQKPWRQKGLGRARSGNKNSPIWVGGAVAHGPKNQNFTKQIPLKMKRGALGSALISKIQSEEIRVVENLDFTSPKTKEAVKLLANLKVVGSVLVANDKIDFNSILSFQNLEKPNKLKTIPASDVNAYEVMKRKNFVITKSGLESLVEKIVKTRNVGVSA